MYMSIEKSENSCFLLHEDFFNCLKNDMKQEFDKKLLEKLIDKLLVVTIKREDKIYVHKDELEICKKILHLNHSLSEKDYVNVGFSESFLVERIKIERDTFFCYSMRESKKAAPVFVRNIIYMFKDKYKKCDRMEYDILGVRIITYNKFVSVYIENVMYRKYRLEQIKLSNFANSSAYMGSKKSLVDFIIESLWPHVENDSVILDIMCGSGSVSNALAQMSDVYASDAQLFCRLLAKIQGAGFNEKKAVEMLDELYIYYTDNLRILQDECKKQLELEKEIFYMDV